MKRRTFSTGVAGFAFGMSALGRRAARAAVPADIKATLNVFRPASDADIILMNHTTTRFKARFPNVDVKTQFVNTNPWGEYINQFMNAVSSGEPVDVVSMATEGVATLVSHKLVLDLSDLLSHDPASRELLDDVEPNLLNALKFQGNLSFLPTEWNTVLVVYNTDMFNEAGVEPPKPGWTWQDLLATAQKLTKRDASGQITQYGYVVPGGQFALSTWFQTNDTDRLTPDGHASNVRDPKFRETLLFLHALIQEHRVAPAFKRNDFGYSAFAARQAAMISSTHPVIRILKEARMTNVDVQNVPYNRKQVNICGVLGLAMASTSKQPQLAWELMKMLIDREIEAEIAANMRSIPSRRSAAELPVWTAFPAHAGLFYGAAARAQPLTAPPNFAQVEDIMMRHIEGYLTDNLSLDAAIDGMDQELSRAMNRVRW
jgi:multiple sugar transport system substrate-binding protein